MAQPKHIKNNRRRNWQYDCQHCGPTWRDAKSNTFSLKSMACVQCMTYINRACKRGAAWICQRSLRVGIWQTRLGVAEDQPSGTKKKSRRGLRSVS